MDLAGYVINAVAVEGRSLAEVPASLEDEIVALRKSLGEESLDAGAHTIHHHLTRRTDLSSYSRADLEEAERNLNLRS